MSFDHIWIKDTEEPRRWLDLYRLKREEARTKELNGEADRLLSLGIFVVLVAGKNYLHDEKFLFDDPAQARAFYEYGFKAWEFISENDEETMGFDQVSLYEAGRLIATKSVEPTKRTEVKHE
jgi:hypothetical protein